MAKGTGLIGNFKGKVGNTVGYKLSASNNGQTQGIRVYQPIVKNPKTAAQAEQRAKLSPINATYRALKMVIDRGNEGLPYGNKSRLAWLKNAFKAEYMPWILKGMPVERVVGCLLTKGSLSGVEFSIMEDTFKFNCAGVTAETTLATVGAFSTAVLAGIPTLREGDQMTFVTVNAVNGGIIPTIISVVLDKTSTAALAGFTAESSKISVQVGDSWYAGSLIISREGDNGEHLRSTSYLQIDDTVAASEPYDADSKAAAIESYRASAASNSDWAEESIQ